jgi:small subunit ribosomal protein S20
MANTKSAKKAIRVSERKTVYNLRVKRSFKEARKAVVKAVDLKDKDTAIKLMPKAFKEIDKAAKTNVIHKNAAARYKSGLSKSVAKLG